MKNFCRVRQFAKERRSSLMVEMAICFPVFLVLLMVIFEFAYDAFVQATLETTLQTTAQQIEVGSDTAASATNFVGTYACPNGMGLLNCNSLYIQVENFSPSVCTDFHAATSGAAPVGTAPVVGGAVELTNYVGVTAGTGGAYLANPPCATNGGTYCNPLPSQEVILSGVYLVPSFILGLIPHATATYGGHSYHVAYDTIGFETENFSSAGESNKCPGSS